MGWNSIVYDQDPTWWRPGKSCKVWSTQNRIGIVRHGLRISGTEPPTFLSILQKSTKVLGPIRVQFSKKTTLCHANIQENKGPSLGKFKSKFLISAARTLEEIDRQERCARGDAWIGQTYPKAQRNRQSFLLHLLLMYQRMVSPSAICNQTGGKREFVVDSGASLHMLSRTDLGSAELETVKISESLTTVVPANGEVQTREEAIVYVTELELFLTECFSKIHRPFFHSENFARIKGILASGPVVRNHNSSKMTDG